MEEQTLNTWPKVSKSSFKHLRFLISFAFFNHRFCFNKILLSAVILLPLPILAPLVVRYKDNYKGKNIEVIQKYEADETISNRKRSQANCFEKMESYWHKFLSFIGAPCIKYVYYFVKNTFIYLYTQVLILFNSNKMKILYSFN